VARVIVPEAWVSSRAGTCGICGGQIDDGAHFSLSASVLTFRHHSTVAPHSTLYISHRRCTILEIASLKITPISLSCRNRDFHIHLWR